MPARTHFPFPASSILSSRLRRSYVLLAMLVAIAFGGQLSAQIAKGGILTPFPELQQPNRDTGHVASQPCKPRQAVASPAQLRPQSATSRKDQPGEPVPQSSPTPSSTATAAPLRQRP